MRSIPIDSRRAALKRSRPAPTEVMRASAAAEIIVSLASTLLATAYASFGQGVRQVTPRCSASRDLLPDIIRPAGLTLNILVSLIGTTGRPKHIRISARHCSKRARVHLSASIYHPIVGALLMYAAWRTAKSAGITRRWVLTVSRRPPSRCGRCSRSVAGITGIGGGILLATLMLAQRWASARKTSQFGGPLSTL